MNWIACVCGIGHVRGHPNHKILTISTLSRLELDFYQCIRLINHMRQLTTNKPEFENTIEFEVTGEEEFLQDDDLLKPVMEGDTLLYGN